MMQNLPVLKRRSAGGCGTLFFIRRNERRVVMAFVNRGSVLHSHTESLNVNEYLVARDRSSWLVMQGDGNVVLYKGPPPPDEGPATEQHFTRDADMYATGTNGQGHYGAYYLHLTNEGELVVFSGNHHLTIKDANGNAKQVNNHDGCLTPGLTACNLYVNNNYEVEIRKLIDPIWFSNPHNWHVRVDYNIDGGGQNSNATTVVAASACHARSHPRVAELMRLISETHHSNVHIGEVRLVE
jgi:hypothetical protein